MVEEASQPLLNKDIDSLPLRRSSSTDKSLQDLSAESPQPLELPSESTPLLIHSNDELWSYGGVEPTILSSSEQRDNPLYVDPRRRRSSVRWRILCICLTLTAVVAILIFAFVAPAVVKQYVKEAAVFRPTSVSIESATANGVQTRVQGELVLDANRVQRSSVRYLGRLVTWVGREIETSESDAQIYLPEYGNILVATASLPSIKINIQNGHMNQIGVLAELVAGDINGIRSVAVDWLEGRLGQLKVNGIATTRLKSGLLNLGDQILMDSITVKEDDFPQLPAVSISKFNVHDADPSEGKGAMVVDLSVAAILDSPFSLRIPPLGFEVMVPNCSPGDPYISVADVMTREFPVVPGHHVSSVEVIGDIRGLSNELTRTCSGRKKSPLDFLVKNYMHGLRTTVYVRGADTPIVGTPEWVVDILKSVVIPLSFTGRALDNLVKKFTMSDVHFVLPNPMAEPDSPESQPKVSALVKVLLGLPKQLDFQLEVPRVRAVADVYYRGDKLGVLRLQEWQPANSTLIEDGLLVDFAMKNAPLEVTDADILTDVLQDLIFKGETVNLTVAANVDAEVSTRLGRFVIREIPAEGQVNVQPPYGGSFDQLNPQIESLELGPTTESSLVVKAKVNITNPSPYSASVPFVDLLLIYNATKVAHITGRDLMLVPGVNTGLSLDLEWSPLDLDGPTGQNAGRELISQYVSGSNATVTVQSHNGTIPSLPQLGQALSRLGFDFQVPKVPVRRAPGKEPDDDEGPGFVQDATLHLWSSTAEFTLSSPLPNTTIVVTSIKATALYQQYVEVGKINYYLPFPVPPGLSQTPRLPVDLDLNGIGRDALKKALGGSLALDAVAEIGVRVRSYSDTIFYHGKGITSHVRL
ncbi:hypothetical protein EYZ11_000666 [Aspergillus tanneri]|uniref:Pre-rRNA processing protein n=1 Tax=Aspergillus tanneri TaxID=1220188 RepID=A0A4S3JWI7_9EURO|nr:uncharacterized protein ATNIH1004_005016 [Aspergillus tanneri]KAA8649121.1 hypothetical protein ATNIH1004_005016 [Aspergillus tanneri]THC99854.1 hypothetical protein EYZ11_000666 [Aspergillus tanneri]